MLMGQRVGDRRVEALKNAATSFGSGSDASRPCRSAAARSTAWRSVVGPGAAAQSPPAIWQTARTAPSAIRCAGPAATSAATMTATSSSIPTYSAATCPRSLRSMSPRLPRRGAHARGAGLNLEPPGVPPGERAPAERAPGASLRGAPIQSGDAPKR